MKVYGVMGLMVSVLVWRGFSADITMIGNDGLNVSSFNAGANWPGAVAPAPGNDYFTGGFVMRTPPSGTHQFLGDSLTVSAGGTFAFKTQGPITVSNLILDGGSISHFDVGGTQIATMDGNVNVLSNSTISNGGSNARQFVFNSLFQGAGNLVYTSGNTSSSVTFTHANNTHTGVQTFNANSTIIVTSLANGGSASALGAASSAADRLVFNGGLLRYTGATAATTDRLFTLGNTSGRIESSSTTSSATVQFSNTGDIAFSGTGDRTLFLAGSQTGSNIFQPRLTDNGAELSSLFKSNAGKWIVTADHTYTGTTTIAGGELQVGNGGAAGSLGTGPVVLDLASTALRVRRSDTAYTLSNDISGAGQLAFGLSGSTQKTGIVTVTGDNSFTGNVTINEGGVRIRAGNAFGTGTKTITMTQGTNGHPSLYLDGSGGDIVLPSSFSWVASTNPAAPGFVNEAGNNAINGNFSMTTGGGDSNFTVLGGTLSLNGTMTVTGSGPRGPRLGGTGEGFFNGLLQNGSTANFGYLVKQGTGTWSVTHINNTYTGNTIINGGTLKLVNAGSLNNIASSSVIDVRSVGTLDTSGLFNGELALAPGQTLKGSGAVSGGLIIGGGGIISPGASPGTLTTGDQTWAAGGVYVFEFDIVDSFNVDQVGFQGLNNGADWMNVQGTLQMTANAFDPFLIDVRGLQLNDSAGAVTDWDANGEYRWAIATANTLSGSFAPANFSVLTSNFENNNPISVAREFYVTAEGGTVYLNYGQVIPEAGSGTLVVMGLGMVYWVRRRTGRH